MKRSKNELILIFSAIAQFVVAIVIVNYPAKEPILNDPIDYGWIAIFLLLLATFAPYFYGFTKTIKEKGYPKIMNLLVFTGIIGFIVALVLGKQKCEPVSGGNG